MFLIRAHALLESKAQVAEGIDLASSDGGDAEVCHADGIVDAHELRRYFVVRSAIMIIAQCDAKRGSAVSVERVGRRLASAALHERALMFDFRALRRFLKL